MHAAIDGHWGFARYQAIRNRLPQADFPAVSAPVSDLAPLADGFDVFVFDSFGVLNVGEDAIPGAAARIRALKEVGKAVVVLTNAASTPFDGLEDKYAKLGFDFSADEVISSRHVLASALHAAGGDVLWDVIAPPYARIETLPGRTRAYAPDGADDADGLIFLSSVGWDESAQRGLVERLSERPRPVWIGNPDLVAPWGGRFTREPGSYAHDIWDGLGIEPRFFGKPYPNAFEAVRAKFPDIAAERFLMLGDTLHTDILGGAAAGMKTGLVTGFGVLRDLDIGDCMRRSGIVPDFLMPGI